MTWNPYVGGSDIVGADDALGLLGVGGSDIVGQAQRLNMGAMSRPMFNPQLHMYPTQPTPSFAQSAHSAHLAKQEQLARASFLPAVMLGVDSRPQTGVADILGGATLGVTSEPSVPTRITDFQVSAAVAPFFNITGITIARLNLLTGGQGVPAEAFIPNAKHPPIEAAILPAGSQVVTAVENVDAAAHRFRAIYWTIDLTPAAARIV